MFTKIGYVTGCVLVLFVAFWLRTADLKTIPPGIYYDEGRKLERAWRLTEGYGLPLYFQDIPEPFDVLIRSAYLGFTGGVSMFMSQMFSIWLNLLAVAATIATARLLYRRHRYRLTVAVAAGLALAVMPPAAIIGRHIYRANWVPLTSTLALFFLIRGWQTQRNRAFVLAGVATGITASFYLGGLFFPPAVVVVLLCAALVSRFRWPSKRQTLLLGASFGLTMIPWLYFYWRIPNWLVRVSDLSDRNTPFKNPSILFANIQTALLTLFVPDSIHDMRYNTFTTAFLNPALIILFAVGLVLTLCHWKRPLWLAPLLIGLVMLWPNILSNEPYQPVRLVGVFAPLSLLTGLGVGEVLGWTARYLRVQRVVQIALLAVVIASPIYTAYNIWYHFKVQPLLTDPTIPESFALKYRIGYKNLLEQISASDQPTYLPIEYLNTDLAVAVLRPYAFPKALAYDGRPLPAGRVILPVNSIIYGFFVLDHTPVQYGLLIPQTGEILILPPLSTADATALSQRTRERGEDVLNGESWVLGQATDVGGENNPFASLHIPPTQTLGVFDGNLELVAIDAPDDLTTGEIMPVTLYWRLREKTRKDYFSRLQVWDYQNTSEGYERGSPLVKEPDFPLNIHFYAYPTVMWQPGEIVADTRWLPVFADAPAGGYRFAVGVYDYPGPSPVTLLPEPGMSQQDHWLLTGQTAVDLPLFAHAGDDNSTLDARFGDSLYLTGFHSNVSLDTLRPDTVLQVQLDWRVSQPVSESYVIFLHLTDSSGKLVAQQDLLPFNGQFPTWAWPPNRSISTRYVLTVPPDSQAPYTLEVGLYSYPSIQRLPVQQKDIRLPDDVIRFSG